MDAFVGGRHLEDGSRTDGDTQGESEGNRASSGGARGPSGQLKLSTREARVR
jgi:hypothetical protein